MFGIGKHLPLNTKSPAKRREPHEHILSGTDQNPKKTGPVSSHVSSVEESCSGFAGDQGPLAASPGPRPLKGKKFGKKSVFGPGQVVTGCRLPGRRCRSGPVPVPVPVPVGASETHAEGFRQPCRRSSSTMQKVCVGYLTWLRRIPKLAWFLCLSKQASKHWLAAQFPVL